MELNDSPTTSGESPYNDSSSRAGRDALSSDDGAPTRTAARTAARQLGARMPGPGDGEEIRGGSMRVKTGALRVVINGPPFFAFC